MKGIIIQFIDLFGDTKILEDAGTKGERCWEWIGDESVHEEWTLDNKRYYVFLHSPMDN